MYQKRNQKRYEKRKKIEKRNQEEEEEETEEDWEEKQGEDLRRGLSNKRYVCSCISEDMSLTFYWLFIYCLQMDRGWRMEKTTTENENLKSNLPAEKRWVVNKLDIHNWTYKSQQEWSIYLIFTTV